MPSNLSVRPNRYVLPPIESGYVLDSDIGLFSAILPLGTDKANIVINPSVETNTTGYTASGGVIARDATQQKYGVYSLKVTPGTGLTDGHYYGTVPLVAGVTYWGSTWFKGQGGLTYRFNFFDTGGLGLGALNSFVATGFWQRVSVVYIETSTTTRRLYVRKVSSANVNPYWVDGLQVEQDGLTTYADGDRVGFVRNRADYYWTGVPHASTSVRIGQSRSGGKVISLNDLGFRLLSIIGLGMGGIVNQLTPLARGGAYYGGTVISDRQFTLVGQIDDSSGYLQLSRKRQALIDLFKPDVVSPAQPVILRYTPTDDCGNQQGNEQEIVCVYQDGMSGRTDNLNAERLGLQFQLYLPFVTQEVGNVGGTLSYTTDITDADYALRRINGEWLSLGSGFDATVYKVVADLGVGRVYYGGIFTLADGATHNRITYWDVATETFVDMLNGVNNTVLDIAIASNHDVWVVGTFTLVNGVAAKGIARWNYATSTWTAFNPATTTFAAVNTVLTFANNYVIIGGDFTNWDGIANADYFAVLLVATWSAPAGGPNGVVYDLSRYGTKSIVIAGAFTTPFTRIMQYNLSSLVFAAFGGMSPDAIVRTIDIGPGGGFAVGGQFTVPELYVYGTDQSGTVIAFGIGVNNIVYQVKFAPNGDLYVGGQFTEAGGLPIADRVAIWRDGSWTPLSVNLPGTPIVRGIDFIQDDVYLGYDTAGTATAEDGITVITNTGSAATGPRITFTGPGRLVSARNITTNKNIFFNYTLLDDETAILDLTNPSNITFVSSFWGNVLSYVLAGSQLGQFQLAPGPNVISVFIDGTVDAGTSVTIQYRITSHSLDAAIPGRLLP